MTATVTITLEAGHQTPQAGATGLGHYLGCAGLSYPPIVVPAPAYGACCDDPHPFGGLCHQCPLVPPILGCFSG